MNTMTALSLRGTLTASMILLLAGCGGKGLAEKNQESAAKPRNPLEITVPASLRQQIKVGESRWADLVGSLHVSGRVEADETRLARVSSPVTGRITELEVIEGQNVKRGQVLATVHSTQLSDEQFAFVRAVSQQKLTQQAVARATQLLKADVIGTAEQQRREAELLQASAELSATRDQLKVLGMSDEAIQKLETTRSVNSTSNIVSSIEGTVVGRTVTIGQVVQPAETIFIVADLSHVWLVADVPEQSAGSITIGKSVEAEIAALPGQPITGKLSFVSAIVNPDTRTVRIRMNLPNPHRRYKPAMLASMVLKDGMERQQVVPATAVVREDNQEHVFVQIAADTFILRRVTLGAAFGEVRVVAGGLKTGDKIVLDGAFHLNNERKRLALQGEQ